MRLGIAITVASRQSASMSPPATKPLNAIEAVAGEPAASARALSSPPPPPAMSRRASGIASTTRGQTAIKRSCPLGKPGSTRPKTRTVGRPCEGPTMAGASSLAVPGQGRNARGDSKRSRRALAGIFAVDENEIGATQSTKSRGPRLVPDLDAVRPERVRGVATQGKAPCARSAGKVVDDVARVARRQSGAGDESKATAAESFDWNPVVDETFAIEAGDCARRMPTPERFGSQPGDLCDAARAFAHVLRAYQNRVFAGAHDGRIDLAGNPRPGVANLLRTTPRDARLARLGELPAPGRTLAASDANRPSVTCPVLESKGDFLSRSYERSESLTIKIRAHSGSSHKDASGQVIGGRAQRRRAAAFQG